MNASVVGFSALQQITESKGHLLRLKQEQGSHGCLSDGTCNLIGQSHEVKSLYRLSLSNQVREEGGKKKKQTDMRGWEETQKTSQ